MNNEYVKRVVVYHREFPESNMNDIQIANQVNEIRYFCHQNNWKTVHTYIDKSGSMFEKMVDYATNPMNNITVIACHKTSHISYSFKNLLALIENVLAPRGISFVSVAENFDTGTHYGMSLLKMIGSFSEFSKETILQRCQEDQTGKAKNSKFVGGVPYGYVVDNNGAFIEDTDKAAIVAEMFNSRAGGDSLQRIADALNKRDVKSGRGGDWNKQGISFILKNRAYIGEYQYGGNCKDGEVHIIPKIVNEQLFNKVNGQE